MTHIGQEQALGLAGILGFLAGLTQLGALPRELVGQILRVGQSDLLGLHEHQKINDGIVIGEVVQAEPEPI